MLASDRRHLTGRTIILPSFVPKDQAEANSFSARTDRFIATSLPRQRQSCVMIHRSWPGDREIDDSAFHFSKVARSAEKTSPLG